MRVRPDRPQRLSVRERRVEIASAVLLATVAVSMAVLLPTDRELDLGLAAGLVLVHAACAHIRLYVGGGYAMPTQIVLVTMAFWLPAGLVPIAVAAGLVLAGLYDVGRGSAHPERILTGLNDAWHAIGAALVVYVAGEPAPRIEGWELLAPLLAAQFAFDAAASTAREWLGRGIRPRVELRYLGWVFAADVLLAPVGLLAAVATEHSVAAWLLAAPLALLLAALAHDRRRQIEDAVSRLQELRRERERLQEVLRRAGRAFAANLDREALLAAMTDTVAEALAAEVSWVAGARHGDPAPETLLADDGHLLEEALRTAVDRARESAQAGVATCAHWHAVACPLRRGSANRETIAVARRSGPFSIEEQTLFQNLADQAGVSLENAELHERVRVQAVMDDLTGLSNHRHLQDFLTRELALAEAKGSELGLIMLDIDDFKNVNDTYGHQQGDVVLRLAGRVVRDCCRRGDEPARYGGEELAIALPGAGLVETEALAERVRAAVADLRFPLSDGTWLQITVSAGVAAYPGCATDKASLIASADESLYAAKRAGKNRTVVAPELVTR